MGVLGSRRGKSVLIEMPPGILLPQSSPQGPFVLMDSDLTPYANLTPDYVLDTIEQLGYITDARIYPLNSYENRVYQVGLEEGPPLIAKFYRPKRWTEAQIIEEHEFSTALHDLDIPVVAPLQHEQRTLFTRDAHRFALYPRRGGHAPELDNDDNLYTLGQNLGRIHALGRCQPFEHRPALSIEAFGHASRALLLENDWLPKTLIEAYSTITTHLLEKIEAIFAQVPYQAFRIHGDCHPGNILWRDDKPNFVDLDDARNGPAIQDLWMLLSGERPRQQEQLLHLLAGYQEFCEFHPAELRLIESLRTLRLMHYAAWLARRWEDPAFPMHFPWFNTERYWSEHILELREQMAQLDEPPLVINPYN